MLSVGKAFDWWLNLECVALFFYVLWGIWMSQHNMIELCFICCLSDTHFSVTDSTLFFLLSHPWASHLPHFFHPIEDTNTFITAQVFCAHRQCILSTNPPASSFSGFSMKLSPVPFWLSAICTHFNTMMNDERNVVGWCRQGLMRIYFIE